MTLPKWLTAFVLLICTFIVGLYFGTTRSGPFNIIHDVWHSTGFDRTNRRRELLKDATGDFDIVLIGDSHIRHGLWSEWFQSYKVANRGISGEASADVLNRIDSVMNLTPDYIIVMVGINDLFDGYQPSLVISNIQTVVDNLSTSGAMIIVTSILQCTRPECSDIQPSINQVNEGISNFPDIFYLDLRLVIGPEDLSDGLHLNFSGYQKWRDGISLIIGS